MPAATTLLQHGRFVRELARALLRDPQAAEDVAQEVWLQALRHTGTLAAPRAWLRRAVRSVASNRRRAEERRARHESLAAADEPASSPLEESARAELLHRLVDAVFALEEPLRGTILARYFRGLDVRALALESGVPLSTVRDRERRALELLRGRLDRATGGREAWAAGLALLAPREVALTGPVALATLGVAGIALVVVAGLARVLDAPRRPGADALVTPAGAAPSARRGGASGGPEVPQDAAHSSRSRAEGPGATIEEPATDLDLLRGETVDTAGRPLASVLLRFTRAQRELLEVRSDEQGRFHVEDMPAFSAVSAELSGYRFLHATDPETDLFEPLRPMRVTLAPCGEVAVTVRDVAGGPLAGVGVTLAPRPEERVDPTSAESTLRQVLTLEAETDADGRALLREAWTGIHLLVRLDLTTASDTRQVWIERELGGRLVLQGSQGRPLVARPGQVLELEATWEDEWKVHGIVRDEDGRAAAGCRVDIEDEGYDLREDGRQLASTVTDGSGAFAASFRPPALRGPLRIVAQRQGAQIPVGRGTVVAVAPCAARAERRLELHELPSEPIELVLLPSDDAVLHGEVHASDGSALDWSVHGLAAVQRGGEPARRGLQPVCMLSSGGAFAISPVELGLHDLVVVTQGFVRRAGAGEPLFSTFPGVQANVPLLLRLPSSAPVRVRIRGPGLGDVWIARRWAEGDSLERASRSWSTPIRAPAPWLAQAELEDGARFSGSKGAFVIGRDQLARMRADGTWLVTRDHAGGVAELALPLGDPGWYQVRVACRGREPLASELLYLEAGEHTLVFEPPPTGVLSGRWLADGTREFLGLELCDEHGRALARPQPLPANGSFRLPLGAGRYRLRFGLLAELRAGRALRELEAQVEPGGETRLELPP